MAWRWLRAAPGRLKLAQLALAQVRHPKAIGPAQAGQFKGIGVAAG
jgi:hypothetical protein